ncbi:protein KRI1 homolog [Galleria mellonella]|uniref:Protein KRI1 homolog n=1 Tax=Galleria mellonella TaxID=7137 RepID=A0ABM3MWX4_GALME|nr:protein KRI1 homolog [Galleria mellonella]
MSKNKLFEEDSDDEVTFKTENEYAKRYDAWREKEEMHKLEQKYGSKALNGELSSSSDSEDESDEPPEVNEELEKQFLKTLALLKTKDPRIYDSNYNFFDTEVKKDTEKETKMKTLTFADSDDDDEDDDGNIFSIEKKAVVNMENKSEANTKNKQTGGKLKDYLTGKAEHIDDEVEKELAPLKALWSDPKLNDGEAFLRDYILNKKYLEDGDVGDAADKIRDDDDLEADEKMVEEQGKFERAYNFRFEEPDEEYLKRFPRTMNYIRPKDDRRSRKRAELRARKEDEKKKKMEEIARLKALKLKEIQEKIAKIKEVTGNQDLAFEEQDIEGDFDPEEHDRRMRALFDDEYYGEADTEKPRFPDLDEELEIENWDNYEPEQSQAVQQHGDTEPHCEDDDFNMDADYDPKQARANLLEEIQQGLVKKRRNRKRKSKLHHLLSVEKPKFVPTAADKTYAEYMEEYYKMDCEDVIGGDLPTRFKYREVVPNDYGLTIEEILLADDKELTQWVPLKKIVKHRPDTVEKSEVKTYAQRAHDLRLKRKVLPSLFKDLPEEPQIVVPVEEGSKKKKNKKKDVTVNETEHENENNEIDNSSTEVNTKRKKKRKEAVVDTEEEVNKEHIEGKDLEETNDFSNSNNSFAEDNDKNLLNGNDGKRKKKKRHNNSLNYNISIGNIDSVEKSKDKVKKKKKHRDGFIVESIANAEPSQESDEGTASNVPRKNSNNINMDDQKGNLKRKFGTNPDNQVPNKKKKKKTKQNIEFSNNNPTKKEFIKKNKFKNKQALDSSTQNPLGKLSDERLKAYGLNPKKYRSFLKYKKF